MPTVCGIFVPRAFCVVNFAGSVKRIKKERKKGKKVNPSIRNERQLNVKEKCEEYWHDILLWWVNDWKLRKDGNKEIYFLALFLVVKSIS